MIEMVVSAALASFLLILLATTWANFGLPALGVEARARIEQEGVLAAQSLACDFAGFLADSSGPTGTYQDGITNPYQAVQAGPGAPFWNVSTPGVLVLYFYGANTSDLVTISYQVVTDPQTQVSCLVRTDSSTGVSTTVARYLAASGFSTTAIPNTNPSNTNPSQVQITITIAYRNFTSTFTLIGVAPIST
jgi:hypothetical protein